ncbi:low molecular weight protein-tyrosine-phosphatase [uncultured Alistipes sp.]|uniref:low molecular weight protein-tyrosine-phosphatase n=1 Tax=uncultured Alistipes sp. TaxID=538949 RepID=UPI002607E7FD|nr:low molecular weight protein-tyrosine-phosphatase [uncultured Alistipes sp.]
MEEKKTYRVLFVCLGNICRSPSAEAVFRGAVERVGLEDCIEIDSAGISGYHAGESADDRMSRHAARRGYRLTSISRPVTTQDFDRFDLIVGMDDSNIRDLTRKASREEGRAEIRRMTDFCTQYDDTEVPDPYYGGAAGFERVLDLLEDACRGLLDYVRSRIDRP